MTSRDTWRRILPVACAAALTLALTVSLAPTASAQRDKPPGVPGEIAVPAGNEMFLEGHAVGTQNYVCQPAVPPATGFAYVLFTPQATLFDGRGKQNMTHFFSPNKDEHGVVRATWQHSRDTSTVWGLVVQPSTDGNFVEAGAIPWLLIAKAGDEEGPTGGDTLTDTTYIQRINTHGGSAPATGCAKAADVGTKVFIPYTADYVFFMKERRR